MGTMDLQLVMEEEAAAALEPKVALIEQVEQEDRVMFPYPIGSSPLQQLQIHVREMLPQLH